MLWGNAIRYGVIACAQFIMSRIAISQVYFGKYAPCGSGLYGVTLFTLTYDGVRDDWYLGKLEAGTHYLD